MRHFGIGFVFAASLLLAACSGNGTGSHPDAGSPDSGQTGTPDGGQPDAGQPDSGTPDAGTPDGGSGGTATIDIANFTFTPSELTVSAGTVVTVHDGDSAPHTVTSESADNAFAPGSVNGVSFDTGSVSAGGSASFTIPSTAPSGTIIPFYCGFHTSGMSPANGHITIR